MNHLHCHKWFVDQFNPFNAACSKVLLFEGFSAIVQSNSLFQFLTFGHSGA